MSILINRIIRASNLARAAKKAQALMGATRLASEKLHCLYTKQKLTDSTNYTSICKPLP